MRSRPAAVRRAAFVLTFGGSLTLAGLAVFAASEGCGQGFDAASDGTNGDSTVPGTGTGTGTGDAMTIGVLPGSDSGDRGGDDDDGAPPAETDGAASDPFVGQTFANQCASQGTLPGAKCLFAFASMVDAKIGGILYGDDYLYIHFTINTTDTWVGRVPVGGGDMTALPAPSLKQMARNGTQVYWATESDAAAGFSVSRYDTVTHVLSTPITFGQPILGSVDIRPKGDGVAAYGIQPQDAGVYVATEVDTTTEDGGATSPSSTCVIGGLEAGTTDIDLHVNQHAAFLLGHTGTGLPSELVECLDDGGSAVLGTTSDRVVGAVSMTQSSDGKTVYAVWSDQGKIYVETYADGVNVKTAKTSGILTTSETMGGARILNIGGTDELYILTAQPAGDLAKMNPPVTGSSAFASSVSISGVTSGGPFAAPPGLGLAATTLIYYAGGNVMWESTAALASP